MRTEEITLLAFSELPKEAQERAINDSRELFVNDMSDIYAEFKNALTVMFRGTNIEVDKRCAKVSYPDYLDNFCGRRAWAWLENDILSNFRITQKQFAANRKRYISYGSDYRPGKVKPCPFSGMYVDERIIDHIKDYIRSGCDIGNALSTLDDLAENLMQEEYEYLTSDSYIREYLSLASWEFLESGEFYGY